GNALEVRESVEVLAGGGPSDVVELTLLLAREMLEVAGISGVDPADNLKNGKAMDHWRRMIKAQNGDPDAKLPIAKEQLVINSSTSGLITRMDALKVGVAAWRLGAGRSKQGEQLQLGAGIEIHAKPGDQIKVGEPLFTLHTDKSELFERAQEVISDAVEFDSVYQRLPLVLERIG
ncbi:MAG: thymidine phosphorylase, partial [Candidatus Nanopelagicaceae bacterium]